MTSSELTRLEAPRATSSPFVISHCSALHSADADRLGMRERDLAASGRQVDRGVGRQQAAQDGARGRERERIRAARAGRWLRRTPRRPRPARRSATTRMSRRPAAYRRRRPPRCSAADAPSGLRIAAHVEAGLLAALPHDAHAVEAAAARVDAAVVRRKHDRRAFERRPATGRDQRDRVGRVRAAAALRRDAQLDGLADRARVRRRTQRATAGLDTNPPPAGAHATRPSPSGIGLPPIGICSTSAAATRVTAHRNKHKSVGKRRIKTHDARPPGGATRAESSTIQPALHGGHFGAETRIAADLLTSVLPGREDLKHERHGSHSIGAPNSTHRASCDPRMRSIDSRCALSIW